MGVAQVLAVVTLAVLALGGVRAGGTGQSRRLAADILEAAASEDPERSTQLLESCEERTFDTKLDQFTMVRVLAR